MPKNKLDFFGTTTGSHTARFNQSREPAEIQPSKGLAKASPNFKPIESEEEQDEEQKKKAIAEHSRPVEEE